MPGRAETPRERWCRRHKPGLGAGEPASPPGSAPGTRSPRQAELAAPERQRYFYASPARRAGVEAGAEGAFVWLSPRRGIFVPEEGVGFVAAAFLECQPAGKHSPLRGVTASPGVRLPGFWQGRGLWCRGLQCRRDARLAALPARRGLSPCGGGQSQPGDGHC